MKILKALLALGVLGGLAFAGWFYFGGGPDVGAEVVIPKEAGFVAAVDFSSSGQRAQLNKFGKIIEEFNIEDEMKESFFDDVLPMSKEDRAKFKEVVKGKWKVMMAFESVNDDYDFDFFEEALDNGDVVMYVAMEFDEADLVEDWLMDTEEGAAFTVGKVDGVKFFEGVDDRRRIYRYGDLFFFVSTLDRQDEMIARVKSGVSEFVLPSNIPEDNLGFMYVDGEKFPKYREYMYSQFGQPKDESVLRGAYFYAYADEGIRFAGEMEVDGSKEDMGLFIPGVDYKLGLVDKVPGEGTILYLEDPDLASLVVHIMTGVRGAVDRLEGGEAGIDYDYIDALDILANDLDGVSRDDLEGVFDSPYAVSLSYSEGILPNFGFYVQLEEGDLDGAKNFVAGLSEYFGDVISEFDALIVAELGEEAGGGIVMESTAVRGGGANKIYLDWSKMPAEFLAQAQFVPGFDFTDLSLELYYGVTGDNVFFVTFYPNFEDAYGENVVADSDVFGGAMKAMGESSNSVAFIDLRPGLELVRYYFELFGSSMGTDIAEFEKNFAKVKDTLSHFPYFVYTGSYEKGMVKAGAYLRIE